MMRLLDTPFDLRVPMECAGCGSELLSGFAFCPRCGLAQHAGDADRRQATVVFADVVGFSALAERLDPEDVRAFQNVLFETLAGSVVRYAGFVEKFVGDAVLAAFGAPVAHEDDPERALFAALDMVGGTARLSKEWESRLGQAVSLHVGIHSGPVVAGRLGGAVAGAYAVTGDTVNTAARLLSEAGGAILVSDATYALTQHRFAFAEAGKLKLRGKSKPVGAYRLIGLLPEPQSARGGAEQALVAPMVGRTSELDELLAAFDWAQRGHAQVVCVVGDAGAGKSRLIAEFINRLGQSGRLASVSLRRVTCSSLGEPVYGVFGAIFREAYRVRADDSLAVAEEKLVAGLRELGAPEDAVEIITPVLSYVLGMRASRLADVEPEQLKRQIRLAAQTLIERRLQQGALLIVVENLHWADAASVELLCEIADQFLKQPLMLLLSHRSDVNTPEVSKAAQSILRLALLSPDATRTLVVRLLGHAEEDAFARVQELIVTRAGGNPLFVEEIVRSLVSGGVLVRRHGRWACAGDCKSVNVPSTVQGLILSRIDRLSPDERRLLQEAAIWGETFDITLLWSMATNPAVVAVVIEELIKGGLIKPEPGRDSNSYRFAHALVHEVVYENLLLSRRTALHERAGTVLERAVGTRPEHLGDLEALGHHWSLSSDKVKGANYLAAAGDWARSVYANEDAMRHYERALRTLAQCQSCDNIKAAVRERLGDLLALTGRRSEALAHYEDVHGHLDGTGDAVSSARLERKIGGLHWEAGDREGAHARFGSGLKRLGESGHHVERAHLYQEIGRLAFRAGDNAGAIDWAMRALTEVEAAGNACVREVASTQAQAYNTLGIALARVGRMDDAVAQIERSIRLAENHDLLPAACRGYANLGVLYSSVDPSQSIQTCLKGLATAKRVGDLGFQARLYANLAVAYCALTDRCETEGIEAAQISADLDRRLGLFEHMAVPLIVLGQIYQCRGERSAAIAVYGEALTLAERTGDPQVLFPCYDGLATIHLDAGEEALAEAYLAKSREVCERAGLKSDDLMMLPFLC